MRKTKNEVVLIKKTKAENFAMHSDFRYDSEMSSIANFGTVPGSCSIASCGYYSDCNVPFLQALIFFIPDLLKLIKKTI